MADDQNNVVNPIQIQKFLNVDYPADLNKLIESAQNEGAPEDVIATLRRLPEKTYESPVDVSEEIGKLT
jgi:hypothetical protein